MSAKWVEFNGGESQISDILNAKDGLIYRDSSGKEHKVIDGWRITKEWSSDEEHILLFRTKGHTNVRAWIKEYSLCNPHPHAEMIIEWARTGREVYAEISLSNGTSRWIKLIYPTWDANTKYSFNHDGE